MTERIPEIVLNDGVKVPAIGFGTYALNGTEEHKTSLRRLMLAIV